MGSDDKAAPGLFDSVRRLLGLVVQTLHVRIGIFSIELREEGLRMMRLFALTAVFLFLAVVTVLLATFTIVFSVWDDPQARMTALWILCAVYAVATLVAGVVASRAVKAEKPPFADTLREFEKDREWATRSKAGHPGHPESQP